MDQLGWIAPFEMEQWIESYNRSVVQTDGIPFAGLELIKSSSLIVSSAELRALSSVQAMGYSPSIIDAVFCEAQLPLAFWRFPRLPSLVWAAFFRLTWFLGYSRGSESFHDAKIRARAGAHRLINLAEKGSVLLMGHGIMNRLIAKELITLGWSGPKRQYGKYWSASIYRLKK